MSTSHPETDRVSALADGELAPAEAASLRAHIAQCAVCARELEDVIQLKVAEGSLRARTAATVRPLRPAPRLGLLPVVLGLAASVLVILGLGFRHASERDRQHSEGLVAVQHDAQLAQERLARELAAERQVRASLEDELAELKKPHTGLPVLALNNSRGAEQMQTLRIPRGQSWFVLSIEREEPAQFELYRAAITTTTASGDKVYWSSDGLQPASRTDLAVAFHTSTLPDGEYDLRVEGVGKSGPSLVARQTFRVVHER